jgi:hypothetical protein
MTVDTFGECAAHAIDLGKIVDACCLQALEAAETVQEALTSFRPYALDRIEH